MDLKLEKAIIENVKEIHQMQIKVFKNLLEKYEEFLQYLLYLNFKIKE
jgi:hypothetical protein